MRTSFTAFAAVVVVVLAFVHSCAAHGPHPLTEINYAAMSSRATPTASIMVTPDSLPSSGQWVSVKFQNANASNCDWIGLYSPPNPNLTAQAPIRYQWANVSSGYANSGSGTLSFYLLNIRDAYQFVLFSGCFTTPAAIAYSNSVTFENYNEPLQVHLSMDSTGSQVFVMWTTRDVGTPLVLWNPAGSSEIFTTPAVTTTYNANDLCGAPATTVGFRSPGMHHTAALQNLVPSTKYQYTVGDNDFGFSDMFEFTTPPLRSPFSDVFIAAYGDMGTQPLDGALHLGNPFMPPSLNTTAHVTALVNKSLDHVLHIGDISYARGFSSDWDQFLIQIEPIAARVPYMVGIGNHESDWPVPHALYENMTDSGGECGVPYERRFAMPTRFTEEPFYSYEYGNMHIIVISTEHAFGPGSDQFAWLEGDLAGVDRSITPWLVFAGHRPMYVDSMNNASINGDTTVGVFLQEDLEMMLYKYEVDLCLWGHHHSYQRSCPMLNSTCQAGVLASNGPDVYAAKSEADGAPRAPLHAIIGMAGQYLTTNFLPTAPSWMVMGTDANYGYSTISANATHLQLWFHENSADNVLDTFVLESRYLTEFQ